jgi:hypothetical protein
VAVLRVGSLSNISIPRHIRHTNSIIANNSSPTFDSSGSSLFQLPHHFSSHLNRNSQLHPNHHLSSNNRTNPRRNIRAPKPHPINPQPPLHSMKVRAAIPFPPPNHLNIPIRPPRKHQMRQCKHKFSHEPWSSRSSHPGVKKCA